MQKILIIEDEDAIRRVLVKIIKNENNGYEVEEAENGLQGLELIQAVDYDLVLCDIKMPKMDGVEVLEKAQAIKPEIPFIMISGHGELETAVQTTRRAIIAPHRFLGVYQCCRDRNDHFDTLL